VETSSAQYQRLREQMVERQIARRGIVDPRVLEVMRRVPRHRFVPQSVLPSAYADCALPIGEGQTISQPYIVALMTEALELAGHERALEIGTGCGYQAAILSELVESVHTIERHAVLAERAGLPQRAHARGRWHSRLAGGCSLRGHYHHRGRSRGASAALGSTGRRRSAGGPCWPRRLPESDPRTQEGQAHDHPAPGSGGLRAADR